MTHFRLCTALAVGLVASTIVVAQEPVAPAQVYAMFEAQAASLGDLRAQIAALTEMDPSRVLTEAEEERRDLLVRLLVDPNASDIPLPSHQREDIYWVDFLSERRTLAAQYLGIWIAHDSIVDPLAQFLRTTPPVVGPIPPQQVANRAQADQLSLRVSARDARSSAIDALASSSSKDAIPELVSLLGDPQLSVGAHHYLTVLLGPHIKATLAPSRIAQFHGRLLFGWAQDASAAEQQASIDRLREWWIRESDGLRLSRAFVFGY